MTIMIGVGTTTPTVSAADAQKLAAALDIQVKRDLKPIWGIDAAVTFLDNANQPPPGVHPILIVDDTPQDIAGIHRIEQGITFAFINAHRDWQLAASHECLEMLVDPTGMKLVPSTGMKIVDGALQDTQDEFDYVLEVCDPIEDTDHAYDIGGVSVSDFYTPHYFDRVYKPGTRYSFGGALTRPRQIGRNGYLSWWNPGTESLHQIRNIGGLRLYDLPPWSKESATSARMFIDHHTPTPRSRPDAFETDSAKKEGALADALQTTLS